MARKTTTTAVQPTVASEPFSAEKALARVERVIAARLEDDRRVMAEGIGKSQKVAAEALAALCNSPMDDSFGAINLYDNSYWPMEQTSEASGRLKVWSMTARSLAHLRKTEDNPLRLLCLLRDEAVRYALGDRSRSESSTNAFSNAMAMHQGNGRGYAHEQVVNLITGCLDMIDA